MLEKTDIRAKKGNSARFCSHRVQMVQRQSWRQKADHRLLGVGQGWRKDFMLDGGCTHSLGVLLASIGARIL